jgi:hypothetical protein
LQNKDSRWKIKHCKKRKWEKDMYYGTEDMWKFAGFSAERIERIMKAVLL